MFSKCILSNNTSNLLICLGLYVLGSVYEYFGGYKCVPIDRKSVV